MADKHDKVGMDSVPKGFQPEVPHKLTIQSKFTTTFMHQQTPSLLQEREREKDKFPCVTLNLLSVYLKIEP